MNAGTVVLRSQVGHARVVARSLSRYHPGSRLSVLVADDTDLLVDGEGEPFQLLRPEDVGLAAGELHRMALLSGHHLPVALKPWLVEFLLRTYERAAVILDHQVMVYDSLAGLSDITGADSAVLVPHVLDPMPRDGLDPDETAILGGGMFSSATMAFGPDSHDLIGFLKARLRRECKVDIPKMRMLDQRWFDFVPSLFPYRVARDRGIDVAYWNLHERPLTVRDGRTLAGGSPLRTFNFSGYDLARPASLGASETRGSPRVVAADLPVLSDLCEQYGAELRASGADRLGSDTFGFQTLPGGIPIEESLRRLYSDALEAAEERGRPAPPDPFDPAEASDFVGWARTAYARQGLAVPAALDGRPAQQPAPAAPRSMRSRIGRLVRARVPRG